MNCLECGKEVKQTKGKRPKIYCNPACRSKYFVKQKKADNPNPRKPGRPKKETMPLPTDGVKAKKAKIITADRGKLPLYFTPQNQPITNELGNVLVAAKRVPRRPKIVHADVPESETKFPAKPYDLKKMAETGVIDKDGFIKHVDSTKMTPGERAMIYSKLK